MELSLTAGLAYQRAPQARLSSYRGIKVLAYLAMDLVSPVMAVPPRRVCYALRVDHDCLTKEHVLQVAPMASFLRTPLALLVTKRVQLALMVAARDARHACQAELTTKLGARASTVVRLGTLSTTKHCHLLVQRAIPRVPPVSLQLTSAPRATPLASSPSISDLRAFLPVRKAPMKTVARAVSSVIRAAPPVPALTQAIA